MQKGYFSTNMNANLIYRLKLIVSRFNGPSCVLILYWVTWTHPCKKSLKSFKLAKFLLILVSRTVRPLSVILSYLDKNVIPGTKQRKFNKTLVKNEKYSGIYPAKLSVKSLIFWKCLEIQDARAQTLLSVIL